MAELDEASQEVDIIKRDNDRLKNKLLKIRKDYFQMRD